MGELTVAAIHDAAAVIAERDLELAAQVEKRDAEIDDFMQSVYAVSLPRASPTAPPRSPT